MAFGDWTLGRPSAGRPPTSGLKYLESGPRFPDNDRELTRGGVILKARDKIQGLLARGQELLDSGQPQEAHLVFGRVALREPADQAAKQGLSAAEDAIAERHRLADEALAAAAEALEDGRADEARAFTDAGLAAGADPERAHALLEQLDPPRSARSRFAIFSGSEPSDNPTNENAAHRASRRRSAFALACALTFVGLGAGVGAFWERAMMRLAAPPTPHVSRPAAIAAATVMSDGTIAEARRLLDAGDAAGAVAVLDRVQPAEAAYPFARQLRAQAERALPPVAQ